MRPQFSPNSALIQAARREIQEEFGITLPPEGRGSRLRLFSVKQTRPVRNVSNLMYNYVALDTENPWLRQLDQVCVRAWVEGG
jgi:8-oxo-dGTP pyrophosphatase MutT (NUDIX family)